MRSRSTARSSPGMRNNADDRIIVESTAQMAHAMRLELVAEGVETEWDAQFLAAAGFDYAQGYHYCSALPAEQCLAWIAEFNATAMVAAGGTPRSPPRCVRAPRKAGAGLFIAGTPPHVLSRLAQ